MRTPIRSRQHGPREGFSLVELVVTMLILTVLAGVVAPRIGDRAQAARDARRMADLRTLQDAVEQYFLDKGVYPAADQNPSYGGWDVSHDGNFISAMVNEGYVQETILDPINDATYHFRYYVYNRAYAGCVGPTRFYVLGIRNFETQKAQDESNGFFQCTNRDWSLEFDYVTGGGASFR